MPILTIREEQAKELGRKSFKAKIRKFIKENDPEVEKVPVVEFDLVIDKLIDDAMLYGLVTERQVASYCLVEWQLGPDFPEKFPAAKSILTSDGKTSNGKAEALIEWSQIFIETLRGQSK
jgi:hypothetical protein